MAAGTHDRKLALIADDNDDIRDSLAMVLQGFGYEVACASNGQEAVELAATSCPKAYIARRASSRHAVGGVASRRADPPAYMA
jgi:DNA-binding NtrC family response regulator